MWVNSCEVLEGREEGGTGWRALAEQSPTRRHDDDKRPIRSSNARKIGLGFLRAEWIGIVSRGLSRGA